MSCFICSKKLNLSLQLQECKCKNIFCRRHKLNHNCSFDYKLEHQNNLKKYNNKVIPQKIQNI